MFKTNTIVLSTLLTLATACGGQEEDNTEWISVFPDNSSSVETIRTGGPLDYEVRADDELVVITTLDARHGEVADVTIMADGSYVSFEIGEHHIEVYPEAYDSNLVVDGEVVTDDSGLSPSVADALGLAAVIAADEVLPPQLRPVPPILVAPGPNTCAFYESYFNLQCPDEFTSEEIAADDAPAVTPYAGHGYVEPGCAIFLGSC